MPTEAAVRPSLTIKRRFKGAAGQSLRGRTDPEKIKRWMGPGEIKAIRAEADARVGGRYRVLMQSPGGEEHDVSGVYREVVANEKLVFTWAWKAAPPDEPHELLVTVLIKPDGAGTVLTLTHERLFDEESRAGHEKGWIGAFDKLEKLVT